MRYPIFLVFILCLCTSAIWATPAVDEQTELVKKLALLQDPNAAQKLIRWHAKGDRDYILRLFQKATEMQRSRAQIFVANAYAISQWDPNEAKLCAEAAKPDDLTSYCLGGGGKAHLVKMLEVSQQESHDACEATANDLFVMAAANQSAYAYLVNTIFSPNRAPATLVQIQEYLKTPETAFPDMLYWGGLLLLTPDPTSTSSLRALKALWQSSMLRVSYFDPVPARGTFAQFLLGYRRDNPNCFWYKVNAEISLTANTFFAFSASAWEAFEQKLKALDTQKTEAVPCT